MIALAVRFRVHHGAPLDYVGVAVASFLSWAGLPGPGESVLIAAAVFAAKHKLDIAPVLLVAWAGATAGGIVGWAVGLKGGRALITAPGPLQGLRLRAVERGEHLFTRYAVIAIALSPSWIAGIHRARARIYLPTNAGGAVLWAVGIGLGAYYAGPPVLDLVEDIGVVATVAVVLVLAAVIGEEVIRRRRRHAREASAPPG